MNTEKVRKWNEAFAIQKKLVENFDVNIILDVGAYIGGTSLKYKQTFPSAEIYSFEPYPESYLSGLERVRDFPEIHYIQKAVTEKSGHATFYCNTNVLTNSTIPSSTTGTFIDDLTDTVNDFQVESISIDDFCKEKNIHNIDILKLDIQGAELSALRGAESLLDAQNIQLLFAEVEFIEIYEKQPLFHDVTAYLSRKGYSFYDFRNLSYTEKGQLAWGDAIFCSREVMKNL